jgi:hypothetical protein
MTETVNPAVKRLLGFSVRARSWFHEFREIALMCVVYNIKRVVKQRIRLQYGDSIQPIQTKYSYTTLVSENNLPRTGWIMDLDH